MGKRVLVIGATGPLGIYFCQEALAKGYALNIFARSPEKLPEHISSHAGAKIIKGKLEDTAMLSEAVKDVDAVVSVLGPPMRLSSWHVAAGTYTNAYRTIIKAMREYEIKRIFVMGTPSIQDPNDKKAASATAIVFAIKTFVNSIYKEIVAVGKLFDEEAEDLDWTIYRIGGLTNDRGVLTATYIGHDDWNLATFRPDVAAWLVEQIGKESPEYVRQKPALASKKSPKPQQVGESST